MRYLRTFVLAAAASLAHVAVADETACAKGLLTPPHGGRLARRVESANTRRLLKSSSNNTLPARWNSCERGWVTSVKDQGAYGTCWAFAACAALEAQLLKSGRDEWDLSEKNLVNLNGWSELKPNDGGFDVMAAAYLLRWVGPVAENNDAYPGKDNWTESPQLAPAFHIQNIVWVPSLFDKTEPGFQNRVAGVKSAIMEYGALTASMVGPAKTTINVYNGTENNCDHDVCLVGWDDNYYPDTFPEKGAWIVKNSWGTGAGSNGYIYVSYKDANFGDQDLMAFIPATDDECYDVVRGYDIEGFVVDIESYHDLQASVFAAAYGEQLAAVGVWSSIYDNPCEILIYTNVTRGASSPIEGGSLACRQTNTLTHAGFTTLHLEDPIDLADKTNFAVIYRQTGKDRSTCVNCRGVALDEHDNQIVVCQPQHKSGNSYFGYFDGGNDPAKARWYDGTTICEVDPSMSYDPSFAEYYGSMASTIKAYTKCSRVAASAGDKPDAADDGRAYLSDLAATNATLYAETLQTFGASIGLVGRNGRTNWASWLAGLDPDDPNSSALELTIAVTNGVPYLFWTPNLGTTRSYTIYGRDTLDDSCPWSPIPDDELSKTTNRFFKVSVGPASG